jgi:predicted nucleic acid-binding Zn ribbon protein
MISVKQVSPPVLASILQRQPLSPAKVTFAWHTAAGAALARAAEAELRPDGTLELRAASLPWAREIERSRELLLGRVRLLLGDDVVATIVVRSA